MQTRWLALAFSALAVLASSPAHAFCRATTVPPPKSFSPAPDQCWDQGVPLFWANECVPFRTNISNLPRGLSERDVSDALRRALAVWSAAACPGGGSPSIAPALQGAAQNGEIGYSSSTCNDNMIVVRPGARADSLEFPTLSFEKDTGEIFDADLELDPAAATFRRLASTPEGGAGPPIAIDLDSTLLHGVGHLLGAAHSAERNAVMFASIAPGEVRASLTPDDVAFICTAYPPAGTRSTGRGVVPAAACDFTPRHGSCAAACSSDVRHGCATGAHDTSSVAPISIAAVALVGLAVARWRRRRAKPE